MADLVADTKTFEALRDLPTEFGLTLKWIWKEKELSSEEWNNTWTMPKSGAPVARRTEPGRAERIPWEEGQCRPDHNHWERCIQDYPSDHSLGLRQPRVNSHGKGYAWSREKRPFDVERRARLYSKL